MFRDAKPLSVPARAKAPREAGVRPAALRRFLGGPRWRRWKQLLDGAGLPVRGRLFTRSECRRVMEAWYADVGAFRLKRWSIGA